MSRVTQEEEEGNSQVVQWLGLHTFTAKRPGSIPGRGTKIIQPKKKKRENENERTPSNLSQDHITCFFLSADNFPFYLLFIVISLH